MLRTERAIYREQNRVHKILTEQPMTVVDTVWLSGVAWALAWVTRDKTAPQPHKWALLETEDGKPLRGFPDLNAGRFQVA